MSRSDGQRTQRLTGVPLATSDTQIISERGKDELDKEQFWDDMDYLQSTLNYITSRGYSSLSVFLNQKYDNDTTYFTHAIKHNKVNALRCMLEYLGSNRKEFLLTSSLDNDDRTTPFTYAIQWNNMDALQCMIQSIDGSERVSFFEYELDDQGMTPFTYSIKCDNKEALESMLEAVSYPDKIALLGSKHDTGNTPITFAVDGDHTWALNRMLISMTHSLDLLSLLNLELDRDGTTHFTYALISNSRAMVTMLRNVNQSDRIPLLTRADKQGTSAAAYAAQWNKRKYLMCVHDIMSHNATLEIQSKGYYPKETCLLNFYDQQFWRAMIHQLLRPVIVPVTFPVHKSHYKRKVPCVYEEENNVDEHIRILLGLARLEDISSSYDIAPFIHSAENKRIGMIKTIMRFVKNEDENGLSMPVLKSNNTTFTDSRYLPLQSFKQVLIENQVECFELILEMLRPDDRVLFLNSPIEDGSAKTCLNYACEHEIVGILLHATELGVPIQYSDKEEYYKVIKRKQLLHWLVERERYVAINNLLMNLNHDQRLHLLAQTNSSGKTPHDVVKSGKLRALLEWAASQDGFYYLPTSPQVIIICNTQNREGAEDELQSLKKILPQFNLIPVTLKDPTRENIFDVIQHTIDNHENISALFVIVMSHGQKGAVEATDGPVSLNEILLTMNVQRLDGKPKVLLVQACQSTLSAREEGYHAQDTVTEADARRANPVPQIDPHFDIKHPDFMVLIASVNGGVAYRNMLIPIFSKNLSQSSQNECLHDIFLKTHKKH